MRNRSMMPVVMSRATEIAVDAAPKPAQSRMMPGHDVVDVAARRVDRAAEDEREQQHEHGRQHDRHEQRLGVAQGVPEAAADEDGLGGERASAGRVGRERGTRGGDAPVAMWSVVMIEPSFELGAAGARRR